MGIDVCHGKLRIRFSVDGKRKCLNLGFPDSPQNRRLAEGIYSGILSDITLGRFDESLESYRPRTITQRKSQHGVDLSPGDAMGYYIAHKKEAWQKATLATAEAIQRKVAGYEGGAEMIDRWLLESLQPRTARQYLSYLSRAYRYCVRAKIASRDPIGEIEIKRSSSSEIAPFTQDEAREIIKAFEGTHWESYVKFRFYTGCRSSEASALQWGNVDFKKRVIRIDKALVMGELKGTKTGKARVIPMSPILYSLLHNQWHKDRRQDEFVFIQPNGKPVDFNQWVKDHWRPTLEQMGIPYRNAYNIRHTFVSHALAKGMSPVDVAAITGHTVKTMFQYYAGSVVKIEIPSLYE
ncbi:MAG TPA: tyrosine-type recombinase/integrase [Allocoleopsis sp.]